MFNFVIQLGAILAVLILYRKRFYFWGRGKSREEKRDALSLVGKIAVAVSLRHGSTDTATW